MRRRGEFKQPASEVCGGLFLPKVPSFNRAEGRRQTDELDPPLGGRGHRTLVKFSRPRNIFRIEARVSMATANKHVRLRTTRLNVLLVGRILLGMGS